MELSLEVFYLSTGKIKDSLFRFVNSLRRVNGWIFMALTMYIYSFSFFFSRIQLGFVPIVHYGIGSLVPTYTDKEAHLIRF